jgi:hypothetical protein
LRARDGCAAMRRTDTLRSVAAAAQRFESNIFCEGSN